MSKRNKRQRDKLKSLKGKKRRIINNIDTLLQQNNYHWDKQVPLNQSTRNRLLALVKPKNKKFVKLADDTQKVSTIYNVYTNALRDLNADIKKLQDNLGIKRKSEHEYTGEADEGMVIATAYNAWDRKEFEDKLFKDFNLKTVNNLSVKTQVNDIYQSLTQIYEDMDSNETMVLTIVDKNAKVEYVRADNVKSKDRDEEI
jgi:hypothetical protein